MIGLEYIIPATAFIGVFLFFWGISSMLGGGSPESLGARMQRYAGGQQAAAPEAKKERKKGRRDIDPFATLSGDVQDKRSLGEKRMSSFRKHSQALVFVRRTPPPGGTASGCTR